MFEHYELQKLSISFSQINKPEQILNPQLFRHEKINRMYEFEVQSTTDYPKLPLARKSWKIKNPSRNKGY